MTATTPTPALAADAVIERLAGVHLAHEATVADEMVEGLRIVRPGEDEDRLNQAADWLAATDVAAVNAAARARLRPLLVEAFAQPLASRRRRDVNRLLGAERARMHESAGVVLLEPALAVLDAVRAA